MNTCWNMGGWNMGLMMMWWIIPMACFFLLGWMALRPSGSSSGPAGGPDRESPEDILKRRYATCEIDDEEYGRRLNELRK